MVDNLVVIEMNKIWGPLYDHSTCEDLTDILVKEAEEKFCCKLPSSYIDLLKIRNGGFLRYGSHPEIDVEVGQLYGIGHESDSIFNTDWDYYIYEEGKEVPFPNGAEKLIQLCGDGHYYICLDYRGLQAGNGEPKVSYIGTELGSDFVLAESFTEYINSLEYSSYDFEYALRHEADDEDLFSSIEAALGIQFENLLDSPGFNSLRGRITSPDYREEVDPRNPNFTKVVGKFDMVWLVPNADETGYVLHPEYEEARWILKIGNSVLSKEELQKKLEASGIKATLAHEPEC